MEMIGIIEKKRDGKKLQSSDIEYFIKGYTKGDIPDYQASAFLMACYIRGLDREETFLLTEAMRDTGKKADLSSIEGIKVDKHSTGGVGDKTTLITGPLAASLGVPVAKMSGRSLGFTGGTVDKMESIPGMKVSLKEEDFIRQVNEKGIAVIGQTPDIAPADKLIYALRDVTGTVDNASLITASIMSKKLALGSDAILLDVKCGSGAFMQDYEDACDLAKMMVYIGNSAGKRTVAAVTDMNQPLGHAIGNSLEVIEAIEVLKGEGPEDITELSVTLAGLMAYMGEKAPSPEEGKLLAKENLYDGKGLEKFRQFLEAQGGNPKTIENYMLFPQAKHSIDILSDDNGYIVGIDANKTGEASRHTGAGREVKGQKIDLSAGIYLHKKVGDHVKEGDILATLQGNSKKKLLVSAAICKDSFHMAGTRPEKELLIRSIIGL